MFFKKLKLVGRHFDHRQDCQTGIGGLGQHFEQVHGGSLDELEITKIDTVEPANHQLLDQKKDKLIHRLGTMDQGV